MKSSSPVKHELVATPTAAGRREIAKQKAALAQLVANQKVVMECTVMGNVGGVRRVEGVDLGSSVGRLTLDNCSLR